MAMEYLESAFGKVCPPRYAEWIAVKEWLCFCRQVMWALHNVSCASVQQHYLLVHADRSGHELWQRSLL